MNVATAIGAGGLWAALRETGRRLVDKQIPMAGLTASSSYFRGGLGVAYRRSQAPRAAILDQGKIVADGATQDLLGDRELMRRPRLELLHGFDPANIAAR
jgi:hypothetical protein